MAAHNLPLKSYAALLEAALEEYLEPLRIITAPVGDRAWRVERLDAGFIAIASLTVEGPTATIRVEPQERLGAQSDVLLIALSLALASGARAIWVERANPWAMDGLGFSSTLDGRYRFVVDNARPTEPGWTRERTREELRRLTVD